MSIKSWPVDTRIEPWFQPVYLIISSIPVYTLVFAAWQKPWVLCFSVGWFVLLWFLSGYISRLWLYASGSEYMRDVITDWTSTPAGAKEYVKLMNKALLLRGCTQMLVSADEEEADTVDP